MERSRLRILSPVFWQSWLKKKQKAKRGDKHNFRKTVVLKKIMACKLKLQNKGLYQKILGVYLCLNFSRGLL